MRSHADRQPAAQIKLPRLQLVWKPLPASEARWHLRLIGYGFKGTPRRLFIYISLRGLLLWGSGTVLAAYFFGTAALAWLWGQNPYNHVTYADLMLPTRWPELRAKRGQGLIDEGIHEIRTGKYATGLMLLTHGLGQRPSDARGRMALAQAYINLGYLHRGLQLLEDGLVFGPPTRTYREALFRLSGYLEDHERTLELADRIEPTLPPGDSTARRWLLTQRVTALEKLHRYDEIERLRKAQVDSPLFALESAWARVQAARGRPTDALREIARDPERFGVLADRCRLQLTLAIAAQDPAAADEAIKTWLKDEPTRPQPRIEELAALIQLGNAQAAHDRLQRFFIHFGSDKPAVILLFKKLCELPDAAWLQAGHREALESGALSLEARIIHVQGLLMAGKISEALTEFNLTTTLIEQAKVKDGGWSEGTRLLLNVIGSNSPSGRSQVLEFFRSHRLTPEAFRFALKSLRSAEVTEVAGELSILARNRFPAFQDTAPVPGPVVPAKPGEKLTASFRNEAEARRELRRIDAELQTGNFQSAFTRLKAVEQSGFPALQAELLPRRIQVHGALRELSELSAALQLYLSAPNVSQAWLRQLALQWAGDRQPDSALTLARETQAKFPQARWAMELLNRPATETALPAENIPAAIPSEAAARVELRRINADLGAGRHREALERIKRVERAKFAPLQAELLLCRIQAHGSLREQTELAAALGYYLSGQSVNQTALRNLALQWDNERQRDSALSLLRATLAKFPQANWAHDLRKKIEGDLVIAPEEKPAEREKR